MAYEHFSIRSYFRLSSWFLRFHHSSSFVIASHKMLYTAHHFIWQRWDKTKIFGFVLVMIHQVLNINILIDKSILDMLLPYTNAYCSWIAYCPEFVPIIFEDDVMKNPSSSNKCDLMCIALNFFPFLDVETKEILTKEQVNWSKIVFYTNEWYDVSVLFINLPKKYSQQM